MTQGTDVKEVGDTADLNEHHNPLLLSVENFSSPSISRIAHTYK